MQVTAGAPQPPAIPIACRCVPTDQWLTTHVSTAGTIVDIKTWLLYKFFPSAFNTPPPIPRSRSSRKRRPMSPIRFAARQQDQFKAKRTAEEYYQEDDYDEDTEDLEDVDDVLSQEGHKITAPRPSASSSTNLLPKLSLTPEFFNQEKNSAAFDPASYTLVSFSTGLILEDRLSLDQYALQPHELLELHRQPFIIKLPRHDEAAYVRPYFEAKVCALKSVIRQADAERADVESKHGHETLGTRDKLSKKRRVKLGWTDRWLVIHKGFIKLSRRRDGSKPSFQSSFESLMAVTNYECLQQLDPLGGKVPSIAQLASSSSPSLAAPEAETKSKFDMKYALCLKFRDRGHPSRHERQRPNVPDVSWFRRGSSDRGFDPVGMAKIESNEEDGTGEDSKGHAEDGITWVILNMRNEDSFQHIVRLIHREAPGFISSTFLTETRVSDDNSPPPSPIQFAPRQSLRRASLSPESPIVPATENPSSASPPPPSSPASSFSSVRKSLPYPSWRLELFRRARRAGMGDIGKAMDFVTFGLRNDEDESTIGHGVLRGKHLSKTKYVSEKEHKKAQYQQGIVFDDDSSGSSEESSSEQEWQEWKDDIIRKRKADIEDSRDIHWESNWSWHQNLIDSGSHTQESGASSPRTDLDSVNARLASSPPLTSYSSADSLLRRTTVTGNTISRPMSPQNIPRMRPLSPLSAELDDDDNPSQTLDFDFDSPPFSQYDNSHALRTQHSEPLLHPLVTSEIRRYAVVSVGPPPEDTGRRGRARTSTIMPARISGGDKTAQKPEVASSNAGFGFFGGLPKPKLRIPFVSSSVAATLSPGGSGPASGSGINSSSSPMSAESRDSLKFATPSGSDD